MEQAEGMQAAPIEKGRQWRQYWPQLILLLILAAGAYLRFSGLDWDEGAHLHPDERFLTLVESALEPVSGISEYFNTAASTLNPNNVGYTFFVYGTLPIFIVRYIAEWLGSTGYGEVYLVGRALSASFDIISIFLVYLIGRRLYRERVGLLAAAFTAFSVLLIQHAHFFVVDPFANTFILAGFYFAVRVLDSGKRLDYLIFGLLLGMAVASKISAAPLAAMAAVAAGVRYLAAEKEAKGQVISEGLTGLTLAAVASLLVFRIFQPYAFTGPSFFGIRLNPDWISTMSEVRRQTSGEVDFPPALQWARRAPVLFSWRNMVLWGMGLPLGLTAWLGWAAAAVQTARRRNWTRHALPLAWTTGFFLWQSSGFTQAMRYQLPVYPILAVLASWVLWRTWDWAAERTQPRAWIWQAGVGLFGLVVLAATMSYAFGFLRIYTEPMTRVEASRWIYSHVPSAVNVVIETESGERLEPLAVSADLVLQAGSPQRFDFVSNHDGRAEAILTPFVRSISESDEQQLHFWLYQEGDEVPIASAQYSGAIPQAGDTRLELALDPPIELRAGGRYALEMAVEGPAALQVDGEPAVVLQTSDGEQLTQVEIREDSYLLRVAQPQLLSFQSNTAGLATGIRLAHVEPLAGLPLRVEASLRDPGDSQTLAQGQATIDSLEDLAAPVAISFDQPVELAATSYQLQLEVIQGGALTMRGSTIVHETSWDDPLPQRLDGYDIGGRYPSENQQLYWPDDEDKDVNGVSDKLERIVSTLDNGDFLFISSNRQYGTIARVPSRYPLTSAYYRALFNCQPPRQVIECGATAEPGLVNSELGYELIEVFETHPTIFGFERNDQLAEESFTVYDHPKVLIFQKTEDFDPDHVRQLLAGVDLEGIQQLSPKELTAGAAIPTLQLSLDRWRDFQTSGTYQELFPPDSLLNRSQLLAVVVWWLLIGLLGVITFPLVNAVFPGLRDGGYGISRIFGLLLFAWISWMLGSAGLRIDRLQLWLILAGLALVSAGYLRANWSEIKEKVGRARREIAFIEVLAVSFFLLDLIIRFGNPDLWHPSKGGEKPMDLSYLTAVLKSPTFPPFDPWFAGGYINYYYFGFVIVGLPLKLLGIDPAVGYNLIIPTIFALTALTAYSAASHLVASVRDPYGSKWPRLAGIAGAVSLVLLGNLGTARMIFEALQQVASPAAAGSNLFVDSWLALKGFFQLLFSDGRLGIALDSWYWEPSRAIPPGPGEAGPITEFPFFTFLYADLHAHMISLPFTVLSLVWGISAIRSAVSDGPPKWLRSLLMLVAGGLVVGALRPTNTWDFPVYLILAVLAAAAAGLVWQGKPSWRSLARGLVAAALLAGFSFLLFQPYSRWYGQGYTEAQLWQGSKTPLLAYLTVYGLFIFVIVMWYLRETYQWMKQTPLDHLSRYKAWLPYLGGLLLVLGVGTIIAAGAGYVTVLIVMPLMVWSGLLILREQALTKQIILFLIGTALALTLVVEVVVLRGDISRMNTVFKFYLQVWTLLSIAGGAAVAFIWRGLNRWSLSAQAIWRLGFGLLLLAAALYPLTATPAKVRDRMSAAAPASLDGTIFMQTAQRSELGTRFELDEDYQAIHWLQQNVEGSPVIVEANIPEYRWGTRMTIHSGLPNVLGWNWHQRQQRVLSGAGEVAARAEEITDFYTTQSLEETTGFIDKYDVAFIVVGQLERIYYASVEPCFPAGDVGQSVNCDLGGRSVGMSSPEVPASACEPIEEGGDPNRLRCPTYGLDKFGLMVELELLEVAFETGQTRIYRVLESS